MTEIIERPAAAWESIRGRIVKNRDGSIDIYMAVVGRLGLWATAEAHIGWASIVHRGDDVVREALNSLVGMLGKVDPQ